MLSRSGFSIRRLIRQPRTSLDDATDNVDQVLAAPVAHGSRPPPRGPREEGDAILDSPREESPNTRAWKRTKKPPPPILVIRPYENVQVFSPAALMPLPETPHSAASSLCSCHAQANPRGPTSQSHGLYSAPQLTLERSPSLSPRIRPSHAHIMPVAAGRRGPDWPLRHTMHPDQPVDIMSENIQQLIRETDEAFKAVGNALRDARAASAHDTRMTIVARLQSPRLSPSRLTSPRLKQSSPLGTPTRKASVAKAKRRQSKKGRQPPQQRQKQAQHHSNKQPTPKSASRWTISENMSELLNGRLFHRLEADEMVTPEQVEEWRRQNRNSQHEEAICRLSTESAPNEPLGALDADGGETPIEPFHLEDLPSRIGAAGVRLSMPPPATAAAALNLDFGPEVTRKDFSLCRQTLPPRPKDAQRGGEMTFQDVSFPVPPPKSPKRLLGSQASPLATIMESGDGSDPAPQGKQSLPKHARHAVQRVKVTDDYVLFPSTPFTVTVPTFRHGPIRFSRADVGFLNDTLPIVEETLDWTAFQMAILGGAGDLFDTDDARADEVDLDDLGQWFDGFGFENEGGLRGYREPEVHEIDSRDNEPAPRRESRRKSVPPAINTELASKAPASPASTAEFSPISSTGSNDSPRPLPEMVQIKRVPIPLVIERPPGLWNTRLEIGPDGQGNWLVETPQQEDMLLPPLTKERSGSADSLPMSPMLDLVIGRNSAGQEYFVPMGYNLGHDLGDYLRWETENLSLSGFYGQT